MAKKYLVEFDRENCIGSGACVAANPEYWQLLEDGRSDLKGAKKLDQNTRQRLVIDETDLPRMIEAAQACPVRVIRIIDQETGGNIV